MDSVEQRLERATDLLHYINLLEDQIVAENSKKNKSIFLIGFLVDSKHKAIRELDDIVWGD